MSRCLSIPNLTIDQKKTFNKDLIVTLQPSKYGNAPPVRIQLYEIQNDKLYIPFAYKTEYERPERDMFSKMSVKFTGELRPEQIKTKDDALQSLNDTGSIMISCPPGFGKTATSIYLASRIKLKTLVICHRIVLINQWVESINKFCPDARCCVIKGKKKIEDADFYIINAINVPKYEREIFKDIGLVICDEAHLIMADRLSKCMRYLLPRYVIGLSATPYRNDGLDILMKLYFGQNQITNKLYRKHLVYRINTEFTPEVNLNRQGKIDWSSVIDSICNNSERNEMIVRLVKTFKDRTFLILCKRILQGEYLMKRLEEEGEDVTSLMGSNQVYEQKSRILIGTASKVGVGFDHPKLDTLLLASDIEQYFIQYLGRVFRTKDKEPIIFDIVDKHGLLYKHYRTRQEIYKEHGGIIQSFEEAFPFESRSVIRREENLIKS